MTCDEIVQHKLSGFKLQMSESPAKALFFNYLQNLIFIWVCLCLVFLIDAYTIAIFSVTKKNTCFLFHFLMLT